MAKKAMIDAARLADELRAEQENAQTCEKNRRSLEYQVKDMQTKLDEAEQLAVKGGKKITSRLEQKIKDLESQFDDEQRRLVEAEKSQRRTTRRIKELTFSQEEDHKNHERMQELVDKLQNKVKSYKKQIEEAEEIAALNLAKFRKVQADLEQSEERADINEQSWLGCLFERSSLAKKSKELSSHFLSLAGSQFFSLMKVPGSSSKERTVNFLVLFSVALRTVSGLLDCCSSCLGRTCSLFAKPS